MKLVYAYDQVLPYTGADAEQVMNTVSALSDEGVNIRLVIPRPHKKTPSSETELKQYYQVDGAFHIEQIATDLPFRVPEKLRHALTICGSRHFPGLLYTRHIPVVAAAVACKRPIVYETYRAWPDQYPPLSKPLCRLLKSPTVRGCVFHSQCALESFSKGGVPLEKLTVIHNGHSPSRMQPVLSKQQARAQLNLPQDRQMIVYTGRIAPDKGLGILLQMARLLPQIDVYLVGSKSPNEPIERMAAQIPNVHCVPWQPFARTVPYLYAADALIIPPSLEPLKGATVLPMKLFLYFAAGRPIFAPKAPDTRELLRDQENACLVTAGDAHLAAKALERLLQDQALCERLSQNALALAQTLTWKARGQKLYKFLQQVAPDFM